jgi:predicted O-linked N-acetylglucosamine transferase (SPINDLY family)
LAINPNAVDVLLNLGIALQGLGQLDRAIQCYTRILDIDSDHHEAHINLGVCLRDVGKCAAAIERFLRAASIQPNNAAGPINLGITLATMGKLEQAVTSYQHALTIQPDNTDAHLGLGNALKDQGHLEEALDAIRRALELDADRALAHNNLLFIHNYLADQPAERLLAEAQRFGDMVARLAKPYTEWPNLPDPNRALRVGFVSGDLSGHPVGYFLEGVLAALASEATGKLELYAYPSILRDDETSKRLRASCKAWHSAVGLSDAALAQRIREDGIDILIDLSGHTANNRLPVFAWKPAPIQVSWLGYFATTGVAAMDYFVADPWTLPPDQEVFFTEKVWRLPETRLCFTPPNANLDVNALPALSNSYITFGCFNNLSKMNDAVVQLWARVLNAVPASRLFLKYQQLAEASVRQSTRERFAVHGIAAERLIFEDYVPRANYLAAYHRVDIALDPFPFPGGTTTVEALWMGIPVLTLSGERFLARQGVGLLMNAGLPDWVASDHDDYVARAVAHASDLQKLAALRAKLRQQVLASSIYDAPRFAKHFETALREMWIIWCATANAKQSN